MRFFNCIIHRHRRKLWVEEHRRIEELRIIEIELERDRERERVISMLIESQRIEKESDRIEFIKKCKEKRLRQIQDKFPKSQTEEDCVICSDKKIAEVRTFVCKHSFCQPCIVEWYRSCIEKRLKPTCPICRKIDDNWGKI